MAVDLEKYMKQLRESHKKEESGFFDLPQHKMCNHPDHNPPSHMVIPYGKGYRHVCPSCGSISFVMSNSINC